MILVAVVGGSGAGKTSVATTIAERFGDRCGILSLDDYYRDLPEGVDPRDINFDSPQAFDFDLFKEHLIMLKKGETVMVPSYNMITFRREPSKEKPFHPRKLIVVEGILVLHREDLRDLFDLSIYIDAPADERLIRRIERDTRERGRSLESILNQYRRYVMPAFRAFVEPQKYYCDIVLPWGVENRAGLQMILNAIENMLRNEERKGDDHLV
ncbi:MAG: uridine kinase [Thermotogota bacterium]|nr:uridine kinase [Thermotogota bacterium]MDK2863958.1 uridine kinase [Thermotogota bacterium]HCZ05770.1 uridine kinase [Thermotogota bacterium]